MNNKTKAAIEEDAKLPTAEETLSQAYKAAGWRFDLSVLPTGCPHESLALKAIESHTQAHTKGLRERVRMLESTLKYLRDECNLGDAHTIVEEALKS